MISSLPINNKDLVKTLTMPCVVKFTFELFHRRQAGS
jgi:hypothetical protein